jgi:hypothetical protein
MEEGMAIRFPRRRDDGSFDLRLRVGGVRAEQIDVEKWIAEWARCNSSWERVWQGEDRTVEVLQLLDEFFSPPSLEAREQDDIVIRLRARPDARMWKDWMAKFIEDFCAAHPGANLLKVDSLDT